MQARYWLAIAAGLFAASSSAASAASAPAFEITDYAVRQIPEGNVTIYFNIHDPDPLTNATETCVGSWATGSQDYPQGSYEPCSNGSFAWNMASFTNLTSFILGVEHVYEDPEVGDPPYNYITNFGHANISTSVANCSNAYNTFFCEQIQGTIIQARIYASIAKRK